MFGGITFLFKTCRKYNIRYIVLLIVKQVVTILTTLATLIIPRHIINATFVSMDFSQCMYLLCLFILLLFAFSFFSNIINNRLSVEKMVVFKCLQADLAKRIMHVPLEEIESAAFLDLKSKAEQFIYTGGAGFGILLEKAFDLLGKVLTIVLVIGIISALSVWLLCVLCFITLISVLVNASLSRKK